MRRWRLVSYWYGCSVCGDRAFLKNRTVQVDLGEHDRIPALLERELVADAHLTQLQTLKLDIYAREHAPCGGAVNIWVQRAPILNAETRQPTAV